MRWDFAVRLGPTEITKGKGNGESCSGLEPELTFDTVMEIYALTKFVVERSPSQVVGSLLRRKEGKVRIFDSRCGISGEFGSAHHVDQTQSKQDDQKRRRQCTQRRHKAAPDLEWAYAKGSLFCSQPC
jgi:hypothetical protein